jgi:hypothetical protein
MVSSWIYGFISLSSWVSSWISAGFDSGLSHIFHNFLHGFFSSDGFQLDLGLPSPSFHRLKTGPSRPLGNAILAWSGRDATSMWDKIPGDVCHGRSTGSSGWGWLETNKLLRYVVKTMQ